MDEPHCRIDVWLWRARFFKTRSLAARMVEDGQIRCSRPQQDMVRLDKASRSIRPGDQLTFMAGPRLITLVVIDCGTRRGPPQEAQALYRLQASED
jgi:Ribosome-associated heat shock protein implicated in the recycling of the 50S subunit (S4 paralog)